MLSLHLTFKASEIVPTWPVNDLHVTGGGKFIMAQNISRSALPQPISRAASTDLGPLS